MQILTMLETSLYVVHVEEFVLLGDLKCFYTFVDCLEHVEHMF